MVQANELINTIIKGIEEKKGEEIKVLDLRKQQGAISDYFVICQANSNVQVAAVADSVQEFVFKKTGEKIYHHEGYDNANWILLDYFNVIVHVFQPQFREFYNLEELWADAEIVEVQKTGV